MSSIPWVVSTSSRFVVYALARPDGRVFYVGKGVPDRPAQHAREARGRTCICRKCEIIRGIWAKGREVVVSCLFETDSEAEARFEEARQIRELGQRYLLCNKTHATKPKPPKYDYEMTYAEFIAWLDWIDVPTRHRQPLIDRWAQARYDHVRCEWRTARRMRYDDEAEILRVELDQLTTITRQAAQLALPLDGESPTKQWYDYRK